VKPWKNYRKKRFLRITGEPVITGKKKKNFQHYKFG
jgi:hypothetical protein